jgi:ATP-dependent DNA ligase
MNLPVNPPVLPMLAKRIDKLPEDSQHWVFEPKWDGFRALVFRDGDELLIQSRDEKPLNRYFPDLVEPLLAALPQRCVLDGEIVIVKDNGLDFDELQLRLHPAASRVKLLAQKHPASVVFFDVLCDGERDLRDEVFGNRRKILETLLAHAPAPIHLTPATRDLNVASDWFERFEGAGLDGVIAKPIDGTYQPDVRAMLKVKHERDCDCVVAGFRWHKKGNGTQLGSLLLGLYDARGMLQHVGVCSSFTQDKRIDMIEFLKQYREGAELSHPWMRGDATGSARLPGGQSRWSQGKDLSWEPLRPELVAEVAYDHMQGDRFRHIAQFKRWRKDKPPASCTYSQLEVVPPQELFQIFGGTLRPGA